HTRSKRDWSSDVCSSDLAPTPSAAAELAVYEYREVKETMLNCAQRMRRAVLIRADAQRARLKQMELRLKFAHPRQKLNEKRQYCVGLEDRLRNLMDRRLIAEKHRLALSAEKMKGLSPLEKLNQGFSFVQDENGRNIKSIRQVRQGERLTVYVTDGESETEVSAAAGTECQGKEKATGGGECGWRKKMFPWRSPLSCTAAEWLFSVSAAKRSMKWRRKYLSWMRMERPMNFNEIYREKKEYIENVLKKYLPEQEGYQKVIMEAMEYSLMAGGKRLRPVLMLETYRLFGGEDRAIEPFLADRKSTRL